LDIKVDKIVNVKEAGYSINDNDDDHVVNQPLETNKKSKISTLKQPKNMSVVSVHDNQNIRAATVHIIGDTV
jgi:hypothetical protein